MARSVRFVAVLLLFVVPLAAASRRRVTSPPQQTPVLDARRSFVVTDEAILDAFSFERVLTTLTTGTTTTPFVPAAYIPLAITNRFDQAPEDGANCGQYRIMYAKPDAAGRNLLHVIFAGSRRMSSRRAILS